MIQFWHKLEETRGLTLSRAGWRERLGCEDGSAWEFLTATGELAAAIPVPGRPFERLVITEVADGEFEGRTIALMRLCPLSARELICFEFDVGKLAKLLAEMIGFTPRVQNLGKPVHRFQLGQYGKLYGAGFSLFFVKASSPDHVDTMLDSLIVMHPQPFVVFVTTDQMISDHARRLTNLQLGRLVLTLDATLILDPEQQWTLSQQAREKILAFRDHVRPVARQSSKMMPFNTPESATWRDVELRFLDTESVSVSVCGKRSVLTYVDLGLVDKRNGKPDLQWKLLHHFAHNHGLMTWKSPGASRKNQKRKEYLAQGLKRFFAIEDEPFQLTEDKQGWRCEFTVTPDS